MCKLINILFNLKYLNNIQVSIYSYILILVKSFWKFSFIIFFLLLCNSVLAQIEPLTKTDQYIITKRYISVEEGLAGRSVFCAVEDKDGFMWFGTSNGLSRYDGNSCKTFTKQNFGLLANEITALNVDEKNHLIITFNSKNLNEKIQSQIQVIDLNNNKLQSFEGTYRNIPFKTEDIISIASYKNKELIFITNSPYQVWNYTSAQGFKLVGELAAWNANKNLDNISNTDNSISTIVQNGSVVLKKNNYSNYLISGNTLSPFSNKPEESIFSVAKNKSFLCYNSRSNAISKRDFPQPIQITEKQNAKPFFHLSQVGNYFWIFPFPHSDDANIVYNIKKGIFLIDDKTAVLIAEQQEISKFIDFNIASTYKDSRGCRWLCTNSGVIQINIKQNNFKSYFSRQQATKPSYNQVRGIFAGNILDVNTNKVTTRLYANVWQYLCVAKEQLNHSEFTYATNNSAFNALVKHKNKFYIGGIDKIFEYDPAKNKSIEFAAIGENLGFNYIWSLTAVSDNILLAGYIDGISQVNLLSKKSNALQYASSKIPKAKNVYRFVKTKSKGLVAVAENGIFLIDKNNVVVDYYGSLVGDKSHHLPIIIIYDMLEDKNGICWIASNGEGLFRWDWRHSESNKSIKVKQFNMEQGLPSMVLYRIEEDLDTNLWIGTYNGLMRFNTQTYTTSVFTTNDGLNNNEFNRTSSFKAADGTMCFGGLDGVNAFNPKKLIAFESKNEPYFKITSLTKYSGKEKKLIDVQFALKQDKKLVLQSDDTFLILEFQLLDFQKRKHSYAYKLEGIDTDWNYIDENTIRLSGLPYGKFKMYIKAQLANGQWQSHPIVFPVIVLKPFYLQLWFIIVFSILLVGGIIFYFRFRTNQLHEQNHQLELKVDSRTVDLRLALKDKDILLKEIHHRVKNNLQVISGLLELQKVQLTDEHAIAAFTEGQSRVSSIALIHQNLYQNENLGNIEFCSFARDLSSKVAELFENQNNRVVFTIENKEVFFDIDTAVPLGLIINELITNSYKYFKKGTQEKKININIIVLEKGTYKLIYKDNGPGLKKAIRFETATSLGLDLIKGLSNQISGNATYKFENGSVFTIMFKDFEARNE
jgi:two-component sensor histidine kinase/ligand-binding sensor domain-containing protein